MASNLLPQCMFTIRRNPTQCLVPNNLAFTPLCIRSENRLVSSRVSYKALRSSFVLVSSRFSNRSVIVRAEGDSGAEQDSAEISDESSEESVADSEVEEVEIDVKPERTSRVKIGDVMGILNNRAVEAAIENRPVPDLRTGDIIEIKLQLPNRKRLATYKGIIMSRQNAGIHTTIRIRRIIAGVGVEIVFPIYSPTIKEIKVVKHRKVRRARLYYLRDKLPRLSTFK